MTTLRTIINDTATNSNIYKINIPTGDLVDVNTNQTLSNKTIDGATNTLSNISTASITGLPTFPSGNVVGTDDTQTLSNKTLEDSTTKFGDDVAPTKIFQFECSNLTAGSTRTYTAPDQNGTIIVSDVTNRVHNSVPSWNSTTSKYEDNQDGWVDMLGVLDFRSGGGSNPFILTQFDVAGRVYEWATANSAGQQSQGFLSFHWPHDYVPNSDTFIHLHISTNQSVTTTTAFQLWAGFGKRDTGLFPALIQLQNITYTFQGASDVRKHIVVEVPLSTAGGSATTLNTASLETDGILQVYINYVRGSNSDNMGNNVPTFLHFCDIHYKSTSRGTKNKVSPFNT